MNGDFKLKELKYNLVRDLIKKLDLLLRGLNTQTYKFSSAKKKSFVKEFRDYINYRIEESRSIDFGNLESILKDLKSLDFSLSNLDKLERIYFKLTKDFPHVYLRLSYIKIKEKEDNEDKGKKVLQKLK